MKGERPRDLKYSETHEWIRMTGKVATIGITDYAVKQLGDITHIELPKIGANVEQGSPFGEIDSVKTTADLISPVSGKVQAVNKEISGDFDVLAEEPFEDGWLIKIKVEDAKELENLMSPEDYAEFIASSESDSKGEEEAGDVDEDDFM